MHTVKKGEKILVTSALPYANGPIHIGHLVEYIQTDIYVRFLRLTGHDVVYCCGDDAHGAPIEIKADELGITPEQLIQKMHQEHTDAFAKFLVSFDHYYTTHSEENKVLASDIFQRLKSKGLIYTKEVESFFDEKAQRYLPDRYVKGECPKCGAQDQYGDVCESCNSTYSPVDLINPYSTITKTTPIRKASSHYFFKLSSMTKDLKNYFSERKFQPEIMNYLNHWLEEGLQDWDISRDGPYFGFQIPGEDNKYFYVWLDAPIGYLASLKKYCDTHGKKADDYFFGKSTMIHFIGKDIIYFHFLFWPAMLMAAGFNLPSDIHVHGYLTVNREKMSKSRGTFFTAKDFASQYPPEYLRYYYAKLLSRKMSDIDLDFHDFQKSINNELVANIGNFCYRTISFVHKHFGGKVKKAADKELAKVTMEKMALIEEQYHALNYSQAMKEVMALSSLGNKYFQDKQPWVLMKEGKLEEAQQVCSECVALVKNLCIAIKPVLPDFSKRLEEQLCAPSLAWKDVGFSVAADHLSQPAVLVEKMEIKEEKKMLLNLKVAEIVQAEQHPDAEKLLVLQINLGNEKRQICAGIAPWYAPETLVGKKIIVVSNLKKTKLRGKESNGMLLAADDGERPHVLFVEKSKAGDQVFVDSMKQAQTGQISIEEFLKESVETREKKVTYNGEVLKTASEEVSIAVKDGCKVK